VCHGAGKDGEVANRKVDDENVDATADVVTSAEREHDDDDDVA